MNLEAWVIFVLISLLIFGGLATTIYIALTR